MQFIGSRRDSASKELERNKRGHFLFPLPWVSIYTHTFMYMRHTHIYTRQCTLNKWGQIQTRHGDTNLKSQELGVEAERSGVQASLIYHLGSEFEISFGYRRSWKSEKSKYYYLADFQFSCWYSCYSLGKLIYLSTSLFVLYNEGLFIVLLFQNVIMIMK